MKPLLDRWGRAHTYLRLSVTDRCNLRCTYCMPQAGFEWTPRDELLRFEEIIRLVGIFVQMGISRVRLTGGEPATRRQLDQLIRGLSELPGLNEISMTTNGHYPAGTLTRLARAGLSRINLSLDTLDPEQFSVLTRGGDLTRVLQTIDEALALKLSPVKVNMVVMDQVNDDQIFGMVDYFAPFAGRLQLRFIEYMPFGAGRKKHLPASELRRRLDERYGIQAVTADGEGGPATTFRLESNGLDVGFISAISEHFCQSCNRLRLSCDGELRTCLSRDEAPSLRTLLREEADDESIEQAIRAQVWQKVEGHEAHLEEGFRAFEGIMTRVGG